MSYKYARSSSTLANAVLVACREAGVKLALAESCTGGLVTKLLTDIPGSSDVIDCGFVTYSNEAKAAMLGVDPALIKRHGAVSEETARAMAEGALARSSAQLAVGITGIAGPDGGSKERPVGLVHFATARAGEQTLADHDVFSGDRREVRDAAAGYALELLLERVS